MTAPGQPGSEPEAEVPIAAEYGALAGHGGARARFHLAIPVADLAAAAGFYGPVLGCERGRSAADWIDWDIGGHQLVTHAVPGWTGVVANNVVDGEHVPVPHFGLLLNPLSWHALADRLVEVGTSFVIEPQIRFEGMAGQQHTMFLLDPSGNALEFKAFVDDAQVFAT